MSILFYDCFMGISGDMNLGALIDLGVDQNHLKSELNKLNLEGYTIEINPGLKNGIRGIKVDVVLHKNKNHNNHDHNHKHEHEHRDFKLIKEIINKSGLSNFVKEKSIQIFQKIAEAEGKIHNKLPDKVHFHEVGSIDSIIDIVGASICLEFLSPDKIISSAIQLGGGFAKCEHGIFPVPAPATAEILKGIPVKTGLVDFETTTPTGAAILASIVNDFLGPISYKSVKTGYGIGFKDADIPNVLRVHLIEITESDVDCGKAIMMECNIDDMNPEIYDYIFEKLFEAGAHDVFLTPIIMKKSRPANKLSVLCDSTNEVEIERIILTETSTIGLRKYGVTKTMLERRSETINTSLGKVRIKTSYFNNKLIKSKAEYEDCLKIAKEKNIPIMEVYKLIEKKFRDTDEK